MHVSTILDDRQYWYRSHLLQLTHFCHLNILNVDNLFSDLGTFADFCLSHGRGLLVEVPRSTFKVGFSSVGWELR